MIRRVLIPLTLLALTTAACGKSSEATSAADIRYPATTDGLHSLIKDMGDAEDRRAAAIALSLFPADYEAWFNDTFGPEVGKRLIAEYAPNLDQFPTLPKLMIRQRDRGRTTIRVEKFDKADDPESTTYQSVAFKAMKQPVTLYSVRLTEPSKNGGLHLYNFVHDGQTFKFVGQLRAVTDGPPPSPELDAVSSLRLKDAKTFFDTGKLPD